MRKGIIYVYFNRAKYEKEGIEKYYVGQTIGTMEQRAGKNGRRYGVFDETCNTKFANSIRKWGWDAFECRVLEEVYEEDLDELEKFYIEQFDSYKNGYNTTLGGEGIRGHNNFANKTEEEMEEIRKKISKKCSAANKKRYEDPKEREKTSIASKKQFQDPEARKKASIAQRKRWEDKEKRKKQSETMKKRYEDPEERKKTSITVKKRFEDPEARKKCGRPGEKSCHARSVYCKELNIIFSYVKLAEKYCVNVLNSKIRQIGNVCDGHRKSTGVYNGKKLTWKWKEDVDKETLDKAEYIDSKKYEELLSQNVNVCK